jgi:hypothetical protein
MQSVASYRDPTVTQIHRVAKTPPLILCLLYKVDIFALSSERS